MFVSAALTLTATVQLLTIPAQAQSARPVHPSPSDPSVMRVSGTSAPAPNMNRYYPGLVNPPRLNEAGVGLAQVGAPIPAPVSHSSAPMPPATPGGPMPIGRMEAVNRINPATPASPSQRGTAFPAALPMESVPSAMMPYYAPTHSMPMGAMPPRANAAMSIPEAPVYITRDSGGPRILRALLGLPSWPSRQARQRQAELEARRMEVIRRNALNDPNLVPASAVYDGRR